MRTEILNKLKALSEVKYRDFSLKLLPKETKLLGVRIPLLRQFAKELIKEGYAKNYLTTKPENFIYQEEFMLYSMVLAHQKLPKEEKILQIKKFVPYIKSWAVCDIFCGDLKEIKKSPDVFYKAFHPYTKSNEEHQIRFFYVIALTYFITEEYLHKIFALIKAQKYVGYYDKMAVSWLLSVAYVKFPEATENFLFNTDLDRFIFKKAISKICDSYRVTKEAKIRLRTLASALQKTNLDK